MIRTTQVNATRAARPKVIIGLGNPDPELQGTYHNAGLLALPAIAQALAPGEKLAFKRYKDSFEYAQCAGFTFVKPLTYMNESGIAVKEALKVLKAGPETVAVAHDDSDLRLGSWKITIGGSAAGHKGILSIMDQLKTGDFMRIRIGIRDPHEIRRKKAGDFVLSRISPSDLHTLGGVFAEIAAEIGERT